MKENIYNQLTFNRLTRAQYNTLANNNQINPYELYFIIDEDTYALSSNTYTKAQVDALIQGINISNYYNKSAVDNLISDMATETYVDGKISDLVNGSGAALDTLKELADALGNDANFATTVTNQLALKANASTTYTKTEVDNALSAKADASTTYTKTEVDNLIPPAQTFKTINGETITGSGNITISAGSSFDPSEYYVGNLPLSSTQSTSSNATFGNILPGSDLTYNLGNSVNRYNYINGKYFTVYDSGAVNFNGTSYTVNASDSKLNNLELVGDMKVGGNLRHVNYVYDLPSKSGTLATTSDIPNDYLTSSDFKTINNESIVGSGNITISGGSGSGINYLPSLPSDTTGLTEGDIIAVPGASGSPEVISLVDLPASNALISSCPYVTNTYNGSSWDTNQYIANIPSGYKAISYMITLYISSSTSSDRYITNTYGNTITFNVAPSNSGTFRSIIPDSTNYALFIKPYDSSISFSSHSTKIVTSGSSIYTYVLGLSAIVVPE